MDFGTLALGAIAAIVIGAGIMSIIGALKRTVARPPHDQRYGDGGPMYGHPDHDGGDGGGD